RAAPAETDDQLAMLAARLGRGGDDRVDRWFAGDGKRGGGDALGSEQIEQLLRAAPLAAGDHKGAAPKFARGGADLAQRAGAEPNAGSGGEIEVHRIRAAARPNP